jgi:hypothetical protein
LAATTIASSFPILDPLRQPVGAGVRPALDESIIIDPVRASRTAPAGYAAAGSITLEGNDRLKRTLNVAQTIAMVPFAVAFIALVGALRPELAEVSVAVRDLGDILMVAIGFLAVLATLPLTIVVHEAVHAALFWAFTRARPQVGFKGWYAFASAPGWYLSRNRFLVVGLGPFVSISVAALGLALVLPPFGVVLAVIAAVVNAAGSVGDLYMCARVGRAPRSAVVEDRADGITWHVDVS